MKQNQPEEKFSEDPQENLHIENQILKLKMQAESGAYFGIIENDLPPEVENDFLKQVQAFEDAWQNVKQVVVYELLGKPAYIKEEALSDNELDVELKRVSELLEEHNMFLDVLGEYAPRTIYKFITEELFVHETNDMQLPGWTINFIYEEFHPNHTLDIRNRANEFLESWLERKFTEYSWELGQTFVLANGVTLSKADVLSRFSNFFESFTSFENGEYDMAEIVFQWDEAQSQGIGHAEGMVQYDAIMEKGEILKFKGPFKLYMSNENGWWNIFYFVFPGMDL